MQDIQSMQSQIIISQQKQIAELQEKNRRLINCCGMLRKFLLIAVHDNMEGSPLVIDPRRYAEIDGNFIPTNNFDGGLVIEYERASR